MNLTFEPILWTVTFGFIRNIKITAQLRRSSRLKKTYSIFVGKDWENALKEDWDEERKKEEEKRNCHGHGYELTFYLFQNMFGHDGLRSLCLWFSQLNLPPAILLICKAEFSGRSCKALGSVQVLYKRGPLSLWYIT